MGLNAYFTYQVVGFRGTGDIPYSLALTAVFVEGFLFLFLSLIGMRQWLVKVIPSSIKTASGVGIGLFLTEIGMSYSAGIGLITGSRDTPTDIGGCPHPNQFTGHCDSHKMTSPKVRSMAHSLQRLLLIRRVAMDWYHLRWSSNCISHVIPDQSSHHHRDIGRFNNLLAVSTSPSHVLCQ